MYFFHFEVKEGEACQMVDHLKPGDENAKSIEQVKQCQPDHTCVYKSYDTSATDNVLDISAKCIETTKLGKLVIRTRLLTSVPLI